MNTDFGSVLKKADASLEDDQLQLAFEMLKSEGKKVAVAESLTGGLVAAKFTELPGSMDVFIGGTVCYSNLAKVVLAGADASVIAKCGVVSKETAMSLAQGIREKLKADIGIGLTGVAGPEAHGNMPPGTVHLAIADNQGIMHRAFSFEGNRMQVKESAVQATFLFLRLEMENRKILEADKVK